MGDHEIVALGLAQMLAPFADRVRLVPALETLPSAGVADLVLFDPCLEAALDTEYLDRCTSAVGASRTVIYTWNLKPELVDLALCRGVAGCASKKLNGLELVEALEFIHRGHVVLAPGKVVGEAPRVWLGQAQGLTPREAQVIALIATGLSNQEIARTAFLSINSIKSYIRSAYRKIGVSSRAQAVLWSVRHGFVPTAVRFGSDHDTTQDRSTG